MPAHNEEATIRAVAEGALAHADQVWVVDDGSTDGTAAALQGLALRLIRHAENAGKGQRLADALDEALASGAWGVITLDADGQHDPADIPAFRARALEAPGALILGDRSIGREAMPRVRAIAIAFGNIFIGWACGQRLRDAQCGMRLYPAGFVHAAVPARLRHGFVFETAALIHGAEAGLRFATVPIRARYAGFQHRPSHFRPVADFALIFLAVTEHLLSRHLALRGLLRSLGLRIWN
ncbi:MAG: glycosyltransferase family 2 protein [Pseudomonadota bacterium]